MRFTKEEMTSKTFPGESGSIEVKEYAPFPDNYDFPMDGAICVLNGSTGFKRNNFHEMFFVLEGEMHIVERPEDGEELSYKVKAGEVCTLARGLEHCAQGDGTTRVFIVCNPAYQSLFSPFINEK